MPAVKESYEPLMKYNLGISMWNLPHVCGIIPQTKYSSYCYLSNLKLKRTSFAAGFPPPDKVQETFQKMYPKVTTVDWQRKGDYHIADIRVDGRELNVWFSDKGKWLMTEVDVETLEAVPAAVAKAFMQSTMASMQLSLSSRR